MEDELITMPQALTGLYSPVIYVTPTHKSCHVWRTVLSFPNKISPKSTSHSNCCRKSKVGSKVAKRAVSSEAKSYCWDQRPESGTDPVFTGPSR